MNKFNINRIPTLTKNIYESQQKWAEQNWKDSLRHHYRKIDSLFEKIGIFDDWKKMLSRKCKVAQELIPEIYMDSFLSINFACMGLYKQANICSRAELETALRLVYFSTHQVEYNWWYNGNEWYLSSSKDVWGKGYEYFEQLGEIKKFDKQLNAKLFAKIRIIYRKLSKYVHSGATSFQTSAERISPKYKVDDFNKWASYFKEVQTLANIVLMLGFAETFKTLGSTTQRKILKAVDNQSFRGALRKSLDLRLRGRI